MLKGLVSLIELFYWSVGIFNENQLVMLDACGGRGNGQRDAEGLARARSGKGSGKVEARGWTGRMGVGRGGNGRQRR